MSVNGLVSVLVIALASAVIVGTLGLITLHLLARYSLVLQLVVVGPF